MMTMDWSNNSTYHDVLQQHEKELFIGAHHSESPFLYSKFLVKQICLLLSFSLYSNTTQRNLVVLEKRTTGYNIMQMEPVKFLPKWNQQLWFHSSNQSSFLRHVRS